MKNESLKLYTDVLIEKNMGIQIEDISPIQNSKSNYIHMAPLKPMLKEDDVVFDKDKKVYNRA